MWRRLASALRLDGQRGVLVLWCPVCLAIGIGIYFALPAEPTRSAWAAMSVGLGLLGVALCAGLWRQPLCVAVTLVLGGVILAGARTAHVAGPVLEWRYYGAVEGRVIAIDRSGSDKPRLTLDDVVLERLAADRTPRRVRISLHGTVAGTDPHPGQRIMTTGHLSAPEGPVEPGGFDFQRMAWFERLGGVGYTRNPVLLIEDDGGARPIGRLRLAISRYVTRTLEGEAGAFAAAITTGDRSTMSAETLDALRASNLAHLLAISGLHMGLLTGSAFFALRLVLALVPGSALRLPIKKIAAAGALMIGAGYLALSGGNVATQRAFIMAAVMLVAVCLDRQAVTLRAVAVAATIVLLLRPEALTQPGFQMSFSATVALVAAFRVLRDHAPIPRNGWIAPVLGVVVSSGIAGFATAPYGAAHFNQVSHYGLIANVVSVPLMGAIVMPAALLSACLAPLGLAWVGLRILEPAVNWIMYVARSVSGWPDAVSYVVQPPEIVLPMLSLGALVLILWRGPLRWGGLLPMIAAGMLWGTEIRPPVLVAPNAGLMGVLEDGERRLSKARGGSFAARVWAENDGLAGTEIAARPEGDAGDFLAEVGGVAFAHVFGRGASERAADLCGRVNVLVTTADAPGGNAPCLWVNEDFLSRLGSIAIDPTAGTIVAARHVTGQRPWNHGGPWMQNVPTIPDIPPTPDERTVLNTSG